MFNWLKKLFKKEQIDVLIEIDTSTLKDTSIISFWDLYRKIGVSKYIEQMTKLNKFGKYHYSNIRANNYTCIKLDEIIKDHLVNTKNKYSRVYTEQVLLNMAAMDSLQWSPKMEDTLPDNVIQVILPNNKKYTEITEDMLSWNQ